MITWFSAGVPRARRKALTVGIVWLLSGAARAEEVPAPKGQDRQADKQALVESRLAAGRAKAGAGRAAEASALYGQTLAAALGGMAEAYALAPAPRPTSVVSPANEQPALEAEAPAAPAEDEAAARRAAEEQAAREAAERQAAAREAATRQEAQRREEASRAALAAAVPVLVAPAPAPPAPERPLAFQIGYRSAIAARDPGDGKHASSGLVFTWLTVTSAHGRGAVVVDLESTRLQAGRNDQSDRAQAAFYGLGFDWTVPFASHGTGAFVGAEAVAGVLQSSTMSTPTVGKDGVLQVMPHAGAAVAYRGFGLFADAGWRFQLLADEATSGKASVGGLVVQGGLRVEMEPGAARSTPSLDVGYVARLYSPNGSRVYGRYGLGDGTGPLYQSEVVVSTNALVPRVLHMDNGLAVTYVGAGQAGGGPGLHMAGLGWIATFHAFATHQLFNPYAGVRLGFLYISNDDSSTFQYAKQVGLVASGLAGVDVGLHRRVALRLGVAYDGVAYANNVADASLSGYAAEAGLLIKL
jgi:hypothetical protein